jgi:hypothetical protein
VGRFVAVGLGVLSLASAFTLVAATQTEYGRNTAASVIARKLEDVVNGQVRMGPVLEGNLLTRAVFERFEIRGPDGEIFVALDTASLEYDPTGFLRERFHFRGLEAARVELHLVQGLDGRWNFERIFGGDDEPSAPDTVGQDTTFGELPDTTRLIGPTPLDTLPPPGLRLLFTDARTADGLFEVRRPYSPGGPAAPGAGADPSEESIWRIEAIEDSTGAVRRYEQVLAIESMSAAFPRLRLANPVDPMRIEIRGLSGLARAVRQPLAVNGFDGVLTIADSIQVEIESAELGSTALSGSGWVEPGDPESYRFDLDADPASFEDLQWLPVPVPSSGGGPMGIVVRSAGETVVVDVLDADARVQDSRLRGSFTVALRDTPTFESLSVRLEPLRVRLMNELLERPELVDGYLSGPLEGSGPIDALRIDTDLTLRDVEGDVAPSGLKAVGTVSIEEPFPLRALDLVFSDFEPRWTGVVGFTTPLDGRVDGTATLDGEPRGILAFQADVVHRTPDGITSRVAGEGSFDISGASVVNVALDTDPLALTVLAPFFPELGLVGEVRGSLAASGGLQNLEARADLETPRGELRFDGRFDLEAEDKRYDAQVQARGFDLSQWIDGAPESALAIGGRVTGIGTDPATLEASLDLDILPSVFEQARIDTSQIRLTVDDGAMRIDTFVVRSDVGIVTGRGSFGLSSDQGGSLILEASTEDMSAWNRWILEEIPGGETLEEDTDLFADFDAPLAGRGRADEGEQASQGFAGSLTARGVLFGNLDAVSFGGQLTGRDVRYREHRADSLLARLDVPNPRDLDSLVVVGTAWNARVFGQQLDSLTARFERAGPGAASLRASAARDTSLSLVTDAGVSWGDRTYRAELAGFRINMRGHEVELTAPASLAYSDSGLVVRDLVLEGPHARLRADGGIPAVGSGRFEVALSDLHIENLLGVLADPPELSGTVGGLLRVEGNLDAPRMELSLEVADASARSAGPARIEADMQYAARSLEGEIHALGSTGAVLRAFGRVRANLSLRSVERRVPDDAFDFVVEADSLALDLLAPWVGGLEEVVGYASGNVAVSGGPQEPRYDGKIEVRNGGAFVPGLGVRYRDAHGTARFQGSALQVDSLVVRAGEGTGLVMGTVELSEPGDPGFDLALRANLLDGMNRRAMTFLVSGSGNLHGRFRAPEITGSFRFRDGDIRQDEFLRGRQVIDLTDPDVYSLIDTTVVAERRLLARARNPFMDNLQIDAELALGPNLWLRSDVVDVELVGEGIDVRMDRAAGTLTMLGTVRLARGNYVFDRIPPYRTSLQITAGTIDFVGSPGLDPNVDITAEYRTRTPAGPVTIWADITGTLRETQLRTRSNPPTLSDSDRLCFLAVGVPCYGAGDERLGQRLVQESVLGTLSSGLSSAFVGSSGLSYLQLRSVGTEYDSSTGGLESTQSLFARTELAVGWYAGEDVFFSVAQPLGGGVPRVLIEWRFSENWSLEARAENRFDRQQFGVASAASFETAQTYGLFIFREWSFP